MTRFMTLLVLLGVAVFLTATPSSARLTDNSVSFADPAGNVPAGVPDITSVTVSNDVRGMITFAIQVPNTPTWHIDKAVGIVFDADDMNSVMPYGVDHEIRVYKNSPAEENMAFYTRYDGRYLSPGYPRSWVSYSWTGGVVTVRFDGRLLSVTSRGDYQDIPGRPGETLATRFWPPTSFAFEVKTLVWQESQSRWQPFDLLPKPGAGDAADGNLWNYEVKILRDLILKSFSVPKSIQAGKILTASMTAVRDDTGELAFGDPPVCKAKIGKKLLRLLNPPVFAGASRPSATCSWLVPKKIGGKVTKGKKVVGGLTLTDESGLHPVVESKQFFVKVK